MPIGSGIRGSGGVPYTEEGGATREEAGERDVKGTVGREGLSQGAPVLDSRSVES